MDPKWKGFIRFLHLALVVANQLSRTTADGGLASLLDLALEEDLVALLPRLSDDGLARVDGAGKADLDVLEGAVPKGYVSFLMVVVKKAGKRGRAYLSKMALPAIPKLHRP